MMRPPCLADDAVLLTPSSLRRACDFAIVDRDHFPAEVQGAPPTLGEFLARLDNVRDGAAIYVTPEMLAGFFAQAFPRLRARFVLVTADSDRPTPGPFHCWLDHPRIIRWFGRNCDLPDPHVKFEPMPLGFAEANLPHGNQATMLRVHRRMRSVLDKPLRAHASFHLNLTHPERRDVWSTLLGAPGIVFEPRRIPPELLWIRHANYAFAISPPGLGNDCHRTWEALLLQTIPIVRKSCLDPLYRGFPVVPVADWREVTLDAMLRWRLELADGFTRSMFERLTANHWISRIREAAAVPRYSG